jgi:hypothetical protein
VARLDGEVLASFTRSCGAAGPMGPSPCRGVVVPLAMAMHLCGTFITFVILPERMFQGNPLLLTMDAEFVGKNLVLIAALVALVSRAASPPIWP